MDKNNINNINSDNEHNPSTIDIDTMLSNNNYIDSSEIESCESNYDTFDYKDLSVDEAQLPNKKKNSKFNIFVNGIISNKPVFRLVLGICPVLAVTTMAINGIGMGLAATFVLLCSNVLISLLRNIIPDKVRIPAFILVIATFVSIVEMVMRRYLPDLYQSLGLFIPLIVVNCIILARAEAFASTNKVIDSAVDGLGMGIGFTISLTLMGLIREILGAGAAFGYEIPILSGYAMTIFILPAGGFLTFGLLMATVVAISIRKNRKLSKEAR